MGTLDNSYNEMRDRIFLLLREKNISQKEFAKTLNISSQTITDWKKGKSHSFAGMAARISKALNTSPSWLVFGKGMRYVSPEKWDDIERQAELDRGALAIKSQALSIRNRNLVSEIIRKKMQSTGWSESDFDEINFDDLATALGVSKDYLLGHSDIAKVQAYRIPVYRAVAAGIPIEAIEDIVDWEEITPELAAAGKYFALRIQGQSMEPRICDGDVVIVRQQEDVDSGDVAIVLVNGNDATCKRIKKEGAGLWLLPNNPAAYSPTYYSAEEIAALPVRIIGKVVELRGKV